MRKTKKLNGLVATTFALALVLLGVVPGIEPLEAQAGIIVSTQISTDYILDFFNNNVKIVHADRINLSVYTR